MKEAALIRFKTDDRNGLFEVKSIGADAYGLRDILVQVEEPEMVEAAEELIEYVLSYQLEEDTTIELGECMVYGIWLLKFEERDGYFDVWEVDVDGEHFLRGANATIRFLDAQLYVCNEVEADFDPPMGDQLVTVTRAIMDGAMDVQGIRVEPDAEHTGWVLFEDESELDSPDFSDETIVLPLYELISEREELVCFFGLPTGYRFFTEDGEFDAWMDEKMSGEKES